MHRRPQQQHRWPRGQTVRVTSTQGSAAELACGALDGCCAAAQAIGRGVRIQADFFDDSCAAALSRRG